jgi:hypothetical protein
VLPALADSPPHPERASKAIASGGAKMRMRERNKKILLMCGQQGGMPKRKAGGNTAFAFLGK